MIMYHPFVLVELPYHLSGDDYMHKGIRCYMPDLDPVRRPKLTVLYYFTACVAAKCMCCCQQTSR